MRWTPSWQQEALFAQLSTKDMTFSKSLDLSQHSWKIKQNLVWQDKRGCYSPADLSSSWIWANFGLKVHAP